MLALILLIAWWPRPERETAAPVCAAAVAKARPRNAHGRALAPFLFCALVPLAPRTALLLAAVTLG
jgi:hypothetical protein